MRALFTAGTALQNLRRDALFEKTATRAAQAATLAAQLAGKTVADLTGNGDGDDEDNTGTGGSTDNRGDSGGLDE